MRLGVGAALVGGEIVAGDVEIVDGRITGTGLSGPGEGTALPGFVDIHTHGFDGVDFANASAAQMTAASSALPSTGVTGFQPTLLTLAEASALAAVDIHGRADYPGARFLGTHLEGPFLSPAHPGAHDPTLLVAPDLALAERLLRSGSVGQVTLAPELPGAGELIDLLMESGVVVALGHSAASAAIAHEAFDRGASVLTHVFNATRAFRHRDPGIVGVALTRQDVYLTAVVDNVHLSREATLVAMQAGPRRFAVVTDAMEGAGRGDGVYTLGNREVIVRAGEARLEDGTIASSVLTMDEGLRNLVDLGWDLASAAAAVSTTPAMAIGRPDLGALIDGAVADVVVVDESLRVTRTIIGGVEAFAL